MMIRRILIILAVPAVLGAFSGLRSSAIGQEIRIAYIRSSTLLEQYRKARTVTETFNRDVQAWNQEAQARRREIDVLGKELEAQSPMLSDQVRREKEQDYQMKLNEYDQYVQSIWGPGGLVSQRNEELLRDVIDKIQVAARKIALDNEYDFVFDASNGNIIYADKEHDLTEEVLEELNQSE
jgi:outer membrane protein